jgi:hypothetical protein
LSTVIFSHGNLFFSKRRFVELATLAGNRSLSGCGFLPGLKAEVSTEVLMKRKDPGKSVQYGGVYKYPSPEQAIKDLSRVQKKQEAEKRKKEGEDKPDA